MKVVLPKPRGLITRLRSEPNELKRKMTLLGYLSARASEGKGAIFLVGGQAVETYTGGVFTTGDVDITTTDEKGTEAALKELGFQKVGMIWVSSRLGIAVHIVSSYPRRSARARTIEVDEYEVKVVGVEDLIADRLSAAKFWKSDRDGEQARALINGFRDSIDFDYLVGIAKEDGTEDFLEWARGRRAARPLRE